MNDEELGQVGKQGEYILDMFKMEMTIIFFDSYVQGIEHIEKGDRIDLTKFPGRGGTDFRAPFEKAEELGILQDFVGIVVLTDGECSRFAEDPGVDVLWILTREYNFKPPYGEVIVFRN
jgi:predicted metal-dependent peptidase